MAAVLLHQAEADESALLWTEAGQKKQARKLRKKEEAQQQQLWLLPQQRPSSFSPLLLA
jgi:hypothetical protein